MIDGAPGEIRTPDLTVRSRSLYPAELRALNYCGWIIAGCGEIITHNYSTTGSLWACENIALRETSRDWYATKKIPRPSNYYRP
jgi:hypothetical protein